ncbi:hypothetical protein Taro_038144 [Colocasia esculenta]|uniref:Uncharacterized protein n=1 Tax=Colocasia esculenta TaxID=4460 RepID=A0A843WLC1_COLES|nr:hypothetical protein [Colocasia esculenta]
MVSTLDHLRSTLETSPRELICQSGIVCRHTSWAGRPDDHLLPGIRQDFESPFHLFPLPFNLHPSSLIPHSPSSPIPLYTASMAHKQAPRRGARARATARPIPADDDPPTERRTKRRHDPAEQPGSSSAKRGRASSSGRGQGSVYPRREFLDSSPEASEKSTSSSTESS